MGKKSGKTWVNWANVNAPNSNNIEDLSLSFRPKVESFINALKDAGASITISSTRRSIKRAYLFHWAWLIALKKCSPSDPPPMVGVDIEWNHGNISDSINGANEMVKGFGLAVPPKSIVAPALQSNHISGDAIDMNIIWQKTIKVKNKDSKEVEITFSMNPNTNIELIKLGKSFGVIKNISDKPHWSIDGK